MSWMMLSVCWVTGVDCVSIQGTSCAEVAAWLWMNTSALWITAESLILRSQAGLGKARSVLLSPGLRGGFPGGSFYPFWTPDPKSSAKFSISLLLTRTFTGFVPNIWGRQYYRKSFSSSFTFINIFFKVVEKLQTSFLDSPLQFWPHSSCESFLGECPKLGGFAFLFSSSRLVFWHVVWMVYFVSQISFLNLTLFCWSFCRNFTQLNFSHLRDPCQQITVLRSVPVSELLKVAFIGLMLPGHC